MRAGLWLSENDEIPDEDNEPEAHKAFMAERGEDFNADDYEAAREEAETVADDCETIADTVENLTFPGMFG